MTEKTDTPEHIPVARRLRAIPRFIGTVLLLFVAWFLITQVAPRMTMDMSNVPEPDAPAHQDIIQQKEAEITALSSRIDQLEAKLKTFEEVITSAQGSNSAESDRITALQEKISQLESIALAASEHNAGEIKTTLTSQQQDIASIKTDMDKLKADSNVRLAAITAYTGLHDAVNKGEPFAHHIKLLEELLVTRADAKDMLSTLAPYAQKGIVTRQELLASFEKAVNAALSPDTKPDSIFSNLKTLVKIRKVGTPEGSDDEAVIARAETALKADKIEDCIHLLRELSPQATGAFTGWAQSAGQFINAHNILESLNILVMQPLAAQAPKSIIPEIPKPAIPASPPKEDSSVTPPTDTSVLAPSEDQPAAQNIADEESIDSTEETP